VIIVCHSVREQAATKTLVGIRTTLPKVRIAVIQMQRLDRAIRSSYFIFTLSALGHHEKVSPGKAGVVLTEDLGGRKAAVKLHGDIYGDPRLGMSTIQHSLA
jgi:hypothetical protein